MLTLGLVRQLHGRARALVGLLQEAVAHHSTTAAPLECHGSSSCSSSSSRNDCDSPSSGLGSSSSSSSSPSSSSSSGSRGQTAQPSRVSNKQRWRPEMDQQQHKHPVSKHQVDTGNRSTTSKVVQRSQQRTRLIGLQQMPQQLLTLLQRHSAGMDHINVSAAFTHARKRLCRTGVLPEQQPAAVQQLLQHLHQLAERLQQQCGARQLANIMSACGHLRMANTAKLLLLPEFLRDSKLQQANPQEVSNTLWAVAILDMHPGDTVVAQLVQRMKQLLPHANSQNISNTLWAVATLGVQLADAQQLVQHFMRVLPQANPQGVSNTLGACSTMGVQLAGGVMQQLVQHLIKVLPQAKPQEVANSLGAVARMGHTLSADQLEQLLAHSQNQLHHCKPQGMSETLWACGRMQYAPLQLLSAIEQQPQLLNAVLAAANSQSLANMAWACGQLGYSSKLLPEWLLQQAVQLLQNSRTLFNMQDLCNLCWSAAVLDMQQYVPQVLGLATACPELWATAVDAELRQLYQVHLWLLDCPMPAPDQGLLGVLSQQQLQQCKDSWEQSLTENTSLAKASDLHRSVFAALQALPGDTWQQHPVLEQRTADGALSTDIAATTRSGVQLAIEVDGPSHFVQPAGTLTGPTLFRNRALAARGHVLVSIPYWEWDRLRSAAQRQKYLLSKLQEAEHTATAKSSSSSSSSRNSCTSAQQP